MTRTRTAQGSRAPRYESVQMLRFVAAFLVIVTHATFFTSSRLTSKFSVWNGGVVGVDIFFVISGFVMAVTSRPFERTPHGWRYFAMRRIVRIVPMYWIATTIKVLTILVAPGAAMNSDLSPWRLFTSYFFLPSRSPAGAAEPILGVGWTLTFEMFFYAIFTIGLLLRANPKIFSSAVLLVFFAGSFLRSSSDYPTWAYYFSGFVIYFVAGMAIAKLVNSRYRRFIPYIFGALVVAALALAVTGHADWYQNSWFRKIVVVALVLGVVGADKWIAPRIPKPVLFLGDASYSLYLFHPLIGPIVPAALAVIGFANGWMSVVATIVVALIVGSAVYQIVERRLIALCRRLPYAGRLPDVTMAAPVRHARG